MSIPNSVFHHGLLGTWSEDWDHLRGLWPFDECCAIVAGMLSRNRVDVDAAYLLDLARQFPIAGEMSGTEVPPVLVRGVCAVDPIITFSSRAFVFTGESHRCGRAELEKAVQERGGVPHARVTQASDFVVVCDGGSPFWAFSCYGRKVEQAYAMRRGGHHVMIVHEVDFWDAVAGSGAVV